MTPRNHTAATADLVSPHASFFVDVGRSRAETLIGMPTANSNSYVHGNHSAPAPPPMNPEPFGGGAPQGYDFRYSQCTGRRKALLVGINYFGQRGQLRGCINDVRDMSSSRVEHCGYSREAMDILKEPNLAKEAGQGLLGVISSYSQGDLGGVASNIMGLFKKATGGDDAHN